MTTTELALQGDTRPLAVMLSNPATMHKFELACGHQAGEVMINIINAANSNAAIWDCEPMTVVTAALNAASMHLSLSPSTGQACILPYDKNKKVGNDWVKVKTAQLVVMLRGVKDMAMRTHQYRYLNAFVVYEGQEWVENQLTGVGRPEGTIQKKKAIGYGAYLCLFNGYEATVYMTLEEMNEFAKRYSPTYDKQKGAFGPKSKWVTDFDDQAKKTVMKKLILNKGVISDTDRVALEHAENEKAENWNAQELPEDMIEGETTSEETPLPVDWQAAKSVKEQPKPVSVPLPTGKPMNGAPRPYTPEDLMKAFDKILPQMNEEANDKQRNLMRLMLNKLFGDDEGRKDFIYWLFVTDSSKNLSGKQVNALLHWMRLQKTADGDYLPGEHVIEEAKRAKEYILANASFMAARSEAEQN